MDLVNVLPPHGLVFSDRRNIIQSLVLLVLLFHAFLSNGFIVTRIMLEIHQLLERCQEIFQVGSEFLISLRGNCLQDFEELGERSKHASLLHKLAIALKLSNILELCDHSGVDSAALSFYTLESCGEEIYVFNQVLVLVVDGEHLRNLDEARIVVALLQSDELLCNSGSEAFTSIVCRPFV